MKKSSKRAVWAMAFTASSLIATSALADEDGLRFRGGVDIAGGGLLVSGFGVGMGGVDGRIGLQINDLIGAYVQPHLAFGGGKYHGASVFTGVAGASGIVDFTFFDQLFVGGGGGFAYVGEIPDPGASLHFRFGGYPLQGDGEGARRKGLLIGADLHVHFVQGFTLLQPMLAIGYEAF
jgi:hypothetical protein